MPLSIQGLQRLHPEMDWLDYLNNILQPYETLTLSDEVILDEPNFFAPFFKLLARTPKRVLANYICWRVAMESGPYLNKKIRDLTREFKALVNGQGSEWWQECISFAQKRLPLIVGALYVRKAFDESNRNRTLEIFRNIRTVFSQMLDKVRHTKIG